MAAVPEGMVVGRVAVGCKRCGRCARVQCSVCCSWQCSAQIYKHLYKYHFHCSVCGVWTTKKKIKRHHPVTCSFCKVESCNHAEHMMKHHYKCPDCKIWFKNKERQHATTTCSLCKLKFSPCKIGMHLKEKHHKCTVCEKWVDSKESHHQDQVCRICPPNRNLVCNLGTHLVNEHYKCGQCKCWFLSQESHRTTQQTCAKCKKLVCNMRHHLSIFVSCRNPNDNLVGGMDHHRTTETSLLSKPNYVHVPCKRPNCPGKQICTTCYTYPFGILDPKP